MRCRVVQLAAQIGLFGLPSGTRSVRSGCCVRKESVYIYEIASKSGRLGGYVGGGGPWKGVPRLSSRALGLASSRVDLDEPSEMKKMHVWK